MVAMFPPPFCPVADALPRMRARGYAVLAPTDMAQGTGTDLAGLAALVPSWDRLAADGYLKDGGRYRRRRHACFVAEGDDVRRAPQIVAYSPAMRAELGELKRFLLTRLYRHYQVLRMASKAARIVTDLFEAFMADRRLLPPQYQHSDERRQPRAIADYIAGMTDRYAYKEHRRLFAVTEYL